MVDDCNATGFMGPKGVGTAGSQSIIDLLRQRARPYLFSNSLPPSVVAESIDAIRLVENGDDLRCGAQRGSTH
ncbi:hypothetical protein N9850_12675 [Granulosicoccus sp.]|nr:hypothetical protein [Granulosicoccus sp.]MDB4224619.1 hypothetical protein [Granulosicoccus sp.]